MLLWQLAEKKSFFIFYLLTLIFFHLMIFLKMVSVLVLTLVEINTLMELHMVNVLCL